MRQAVKNTRTRTRQIAKLQYPLLRDDDNEYPLQPDHLCPICNTSLKTSKVLIWVQGHGYIRAEHPVMIFRRSGFFDFAMWAPGKWQYDRPWSRIKIVSDVDEGQWSIGFCSTACLKKFITHTFKDLTSQLETDKALRSRKDAEAPVPQTRTSPASLRLPLPAKEVSLRASDPRRHCALCRRRVNLLGNMVSITGGALYPGADRRRTNSSFNIWVHVYHAGQESWQTIDIIENAPGSNWAILFCSTQCAIHFWDKLINEAERSKMQLMRELKGLQTGE